MKTELEKVAENFIPKSNKLTIKDIFIDGAKWQQEQDKKLYSEEDMISFGKFMFYYGSNEYKEYKDIFNEWFEQFKNK
jgi:hypothetical protein